MAQTKIKAGLFEGIIGNGTDGYFLMSNGDGTMTWSSIIINPTITSIAYPGSVTAADPDGGETITVTGTGFKTGATVTVGGTAASPVSYVSNTQITFSAPAKAAGDYDIVVTNTDTGSATYINGISYNGIPSWTTATGSLGTFASGATISTITLQATEPDAGTITFNITNGALPTGLSLTGADIDGTTSLETADTLYTFTVTATDDESQSTPRTFTITVKKEFKSVENFTINTYTGNGSTQSIEGKIGTAASFNGSSSNISLPTSIKPSNSIMSISLWASNNSTARKNIFYLEYNNAPSFLALENNLYTDSTALGVYYNNTIVITAANETLPTDGSWHHIVVTASATEIKLYKNGSQIGSTASVTVNTNALTEAHIGVRHYNNDLYWDGKIDQVRIFNKELSTDNNGVNEITTLYSENNASSTKSTTDIFGDGSGVALYEFEKGAIDTGGVSGYIGSGGIFNGSSSEINLPQILPPNSTSSSSFSCWFNTSDNSGTRQTIVNAYNLGGTSQAGWTLFKDAGNVLYLRSYYLDGSNITSTYGTINVSDGNWHHVAVIFDISANTLNVYLDNNSTPEISITGLTVSSVYIFESNGSIGYQTNSARHFNGKIDQVRIFSKALSSSEVTTLSDETSASSTKSTTDIFDDSSGVALYELEGNANDTPRGAIDTGQSAVFNGSSSNINISTELIPTTSNFSLSFWIYRNNTLETDLFNQATLSGDIRTYFKLYSNGTLGVASAGGSGSRIQVPATSSTVTNGQWEHIVIVRDGSNMTFYINGTGETETISGGTIGAGRGDFVIISNNALDGKLDQIRIYSSALSSSDVNNLYNETSVPAANLVAHYKLDGDATDETGTYNGTANNITYSDPAEFPTYDGTATNVSYAYDGTPTNVSFVGTSFKPDFVWIKSRATELHALTNSVRSVDSILASNSTYAESTFSSSWRGNYGQITSFDSNGFSINNGSIAGTGPFNVNGVNHVAWCWKAASSNSTNTDGTITSTVRANQDAGFSIVDWTGVGTVGHGLSVAPEMIIVKRYNSTTEWLVYTSTTGATQKLVLNTNAQAASTSVWNNTNPTNSVFSAGSTFDGSPAIAYCFHSVDGYQKVGSYSGTGSAGNAQTLGFRPRFVMIKTTSTTGSWAIVDSVRPNANYLFADTSASETTSTFMNLESDGFSFAGATGNDLNVNFIYLAIA